MQTVREKGAEGESREGHGILRPPIPKTIPRARGNKASAWTKWEDGGRRANRHGEPGKKNAEAMPCRKNQRHAKQVTRLFFESRSGMCRDTCRHVFQTQVSQEKKTGECLNKDRKLHLHLKSCPS